MSNKTLCIYHSRDLDGWMSAAIVQLWFEKNNELNCTLNYFSPESKLEREIESSPASLHMLGYDYGDDIPKIKGYDKVIMCDVSLPARVMHDLYSYYGDQFIWIDHHESAIKEMGKVFQEKASHSPYKENEADNLNYLIAGHRDTKAAACELTWMHFFPSFSSASHWEGMPEIVRLLGRYDCFGHKDTEEEQKVMEVQYGARAFMKNYEDCYSFLNQELYNKSDIVNRLHIQGVSIYKYLCTEAQQIYAKSFPMVFTESSINISSNGNVGIGCAPPSEKLNIVGDVGDITTVVNTDTDEETEVYYKSESYNFLVVNHERFNPINFGIDYHKENYDGYGCFWYNKGKWSWSLYNDNGSVDCSIIAKQFVGGGHQNAAGFVLSEEDHTFLLKTNKRSLNDLSTSKVQSK